MAKAKKDISKEVTIKKRSEVQDSFNVSVEWVESLNVSEMTIIEIMHQKNLSREGAIDFIRTNQNKK